MLFLKISSVNKTQILFSKIGRNIKSHHRIFENARFPVKMLQNKLILSRRLLLSHSRFFASRPEFSTKKSDNVELYKVLDTHPDATLTEIREAYYRKVKQLHPDINPSEDAKKQFELVQEAYKILSNVDRRVGYDRSLKTGDAKYQEAETPKEVRERIQQKKEDQTVYHQKRQELRKDKGLTWSFKDEIGSGAQNLKMDPVRNRMTAEELEELRQNDPIYKRISALKKKGKDNSSAIFDEDKIDYKESQKSALKYTGLLISLVCIYYLAVIPDPGQ